MGHRLTRGIASQFRKPNGLLGSIVGRIMAKGNAPIYDELIGYMNIEKNDSLFEIGYGPGVGADKILSQTDSCIIEGIDFSELMFEKAAVKNKKFIEKGRLKLSLGDFVKSEIAPGGFDKIYFTNVIYFWESLPEPFAKLHSLVKKGGSVFFYMAGADYLKKNKRTDTDIFNKYSIEQVERELLNAGFCKVEYYFKKGYYIKAIK